jgi:hypothetical protein
MGRKLFAVDEPTTEFSKGIHMLKPHSQFLSCIYDEVTPLGNIGRGTHCSIFRCAEWYDGLRNRLFQAEVHDFAVVWDEDHDARVLVAAERLYLAGIFSPVLFIGERKGTLTVVVDQEFRDSLDDEADWQQWVADVNAECGEIDGDFWEVSIGSCDSGHSDRSAHERRVDAAGLIHDNRDRVSAYLRNIDLLWTLGTWPQRKKVANGSADCGIALEPRAKLNDEIATF